MIYKITLEDNSRVYDSFDYLQESGDFVIYDSSIILHSSIQKVKIKNSMKKIYGKDFSFILKEIKGRDILSLPKVVSTWYASDVATLNKEQIEKYQKEALLILDEVIQILIEGGENINVGEQNTE